MYGKFTLVRFHKCMVNLVGWFPAENKRVPVSAHYKNKTQHTSHFLMHFLIRHSRIRVTLHYEIDQSMISISDMKKISWGEAKQNPRDSTQAPMYINLFEIYWQKLNILIKITISLVDTKPDIKFDFHRFI